MHIFFAVRIVFTHGNVSIPMKFIFYNERWLGEKLANCTFWRHSIQQASANLVIVVTEDNTCISWPVIVPYFIVYGTENQP